MGSVHVAWRGSCPQRDVQRELIGCLQELADRSAARLLAPKAPRPAFLEMLAAHRGAATVETAPIRRFDGEIKGRIVVDPNLAIDGQVLYEQARRADAEMIAVAAGGTDKSEPNCLNLDGAGAQWCLGLSRLRLHGIDFRLFDPRDLYPDADRMSFVFLDCPGLPALTGCVAKVESREQSALYGSEAIRSADWFVSAPSIHLRYYLEEWTDHLLGWVKYFFMPDLQFHRYEPLSGYEALRAVLDQASNDGDLPGLKRAALLALANGFERAADEWIGKLHGWAMESATPS